MESLVKRYFWVVNLALLAILALLAAKALNNHLAGRIAGLPTGIAAPEEVKASAADRRRAEEWAQSIINRNLFNSDPPEPEEALPEDPIAEVEPEIDPNKIPGPPPDPCDKSEAGISLIATMEADPADWSMAAVETGDGDRIVRIGQTIEEKQVMAIYRTRLVLAGSGKFECVEIGEKKTRKRPSRRPTASRGGKADSSIKDGVTKTGKNTYQIDRAMLNEQLEDLGKLSRQARVIPHYRDGKPQGFKIVGVRPGSLYSHIGVRSGDVLKSVNGEEVTSPTKALELYEQLKNSDNVTLEVERRGRLTNLEYDIK